MTSATGRDSSGARLAGAMVRRIAAALLALGVCLSIGLSAAPGALAQAPATDPSVTTLAPATTVPASDAPATARESVRPIVLALLACSALVLVATIVYWRVTTPYPPALEGLARLGTGSGRSGTGR